MADFADIGSGYTERWLEAQIEEHQYQLNHAVSAFELGRCLNCEEKLDDGRRWCSPECCQDWTLRQQAIERNRGA